MKKGLLALFVATLLLAISSCCKKEGDERESLSVGGGKKFLSLSSKGGKGNLMIYSTSLWQVSSDANWVEFSTIEGRAGESSLEINVKPNEGAARYTILKFKNDFEYVNFVVSQSSGLVNGDEPTHYFYVTFGTLPTLYAGLNMLAIEKPSYFYYGRVNTFNPDKMPAHVTCLSHLATKEETMRDIMKARIREINEDYPLSVFGMMVDDLRARIPYDWFVSQGIDSSRVKVTLLSDGMGTYNEFHKIFGSGATGEQEWNKYKAYVEELYWDQGFSSPKSRILPEFESWNWSYYLSTLPGYTYMLQHSSLLETESDYVKEQIKSMKCIDVTPEELLKDLTPEARKRFYEMANFDYDVFAALFDASPKPNLIITGTSGQADEQRTYTDKMYLKYKDTHDIFFKPHPADKSSESYESDFPGLKLLPGQMPFEIFVWSLMDKIDVLGGFPSTIYITVPVDKVNFIFAPNAQSLVRPLNLLFANAPNVEWVQ